MGSNNLLNAIFILLCLLMMAKSECPQNGEEFLVTFHPHLDAFWLNTDDQLKRIDFSPAGFLYAMNQRNAKVILNSMLDSLKKNQQRKYFITEIVFFKDWFEYINDSQKKQVRDLFKKGQFQIVNGGWVQNDEAVCYMDDIIDQYTIGNNYLYSQFGIKTNIGWATDSFGHSHSQVALQHLLGIQFQGIQRIDDRYIYQRKVNPLLQFYWSPVSDSNKKKYGGVFTHVRHFLHEVNDLRNTDQNSIKDDFQKLGTNMKKLYKTNKLFRFLGNDFEEYVPAQFQMLQKSIKILNKNPECPVYKYGNPSDYLQRLKTLFKDKSPVRQFDFMPNYDQDHYWSGYYTTNPELKKVCKDFSRLVNLLRKIYINYLTSNGDKKPNIRQLINKSDQLLTVMQHHDGITATSKYHIEQLFKNRMNSKTEEIIKAITSLKSYPKQNCKIYQGSNTCEIDSSESKLYLSIIHEGGLKKQRIQLTFIKDTLYDVTSDSNDQIFCHPISKRCSLLFQPELRSGENVFILEKIDKSKALNTIKAQGSTYKGKDFSVSVSDGHQITYNFNDKFIKISYVRSYNQVTSTDSQSWDKYGFKSIKNQRRLPGIYIMSNNGKIQKQQYQFKDIYVAIGKIFTKIYLPGRHDVILTIKNSQRHLLDLSTKFKPPSQTTFDFFIQISSNIDSKGQFYHDSNGYLVSKRKVGYRPDYQWKYKNQDKINANTYPMCSFAYAIQGDKKLVIFTDRPQGFAQYDNTYLVNIDRLADDDYKGVGQGYRITKENIYNHKIGLVKSNQFIEREWQKSFDQPLLGYYSKDQRSSSQSSNPKVSQLSTFLKYTVFNLNEDQYVLRLFNLAEDKDIKLKKYQSKSWSIPELGLKLSFGDIKESFANGIQISQKTVWKNIEGEINIFNAKSKDQQEWIVLSPLQIRSFRINLKGKPEKNDIQEEQPTTKEQIKEQPKDQLKEQPKEQPKQQPKQVSQPQEPIPEQQPKQNTVSEALPQPSPISQSPNNYLLDVQIRDIIAIQQQGCNE